MRVTRRFQIAGTDRDGKFTRADYIKCFDLFVADGDSYIIEAEFKGKVLIPSFSFALLNVNGDRKSIGGSMAWPSAFSTPGCD